MVRARKSQAARLAKRAKIFALAKGFRGRQKNCYSLAIRAVHHKLQFQYVSRRVKKRELKALWINRVNVAAREHNINYSHFMCNLKKCEVGLNRKVLADLAIHEPRTFKVVTKSEHKHLGLILDSQLDFPSHIREKIISVRRGTGVIRYLSKYVSCDVLDQESLAELAKRRLEDGLLAAIK